MKKESNKKQIISLVILAIFILSSLGFGIMQMGSEPQQTVNDFKPCRNSSDCILICDGQPVYSNCTDNMCEIMECP